MNMKKQSESLVFRLAGLVAKRLAFWSCLLLLLICPPGAWAGNTSLDGLPDGLYAVMETNRGPVVLELYFKQTPLTVINFAGLAMGTMKTDVKKGQPFYDGLIFHRVIQDFMIQGGDPLGNGTGGPGYQFSDEFRPELRHKGPGILSMANSGPGTNGSQFFITHKATPWLDFKHTVFGQVVQGQAVVDRITKGDSIETIRIIPKGTEAEAFEISQAAFDRVLEGQAEVARAEAEADRAAFRAQMLKRYPDAVGLPSGLMYVPLKPGTGRGAEKGQTVSIHFKGLLDDGRLFLSSRDRDMPYTFTLGADEVLKALDLGVVGMKLGELRRILVPYDLGYGKKGHPGVIPPKATILFDVELLEIK